MVTITCSEPLLAVLILVNSDPELVVGVSVRGLFLELPMSPPIDFLVITLGLASIGILYLPPSVCKLFFDALP
jgi:hypothetical protein